MKKIILYLILISLLSTNCFSAGISDFISDNEIIPQDTENSRKTYIVEVEDSVFSKDGVTLFSTEDDIPSYVLGEIESALPDVEGEFVYTTVMQGFSITADSEDYEKILNTPGVKNVYESQTLEIIYPVNGTTFYGTPVGPISYPLYTGAGEVIAIIDSEFNTEHEYFSHIPPTPALSRDDISVAAGSLSVDIDASMAYVSPKIPFAYDYGEGDYDTRYDDMSHGTHVAGIAAGKNGPVLSGSPLNGTAPDSQLLLMKVSTSKSVINMSSAIAAIDDAVKLGASVINMSFGTANESVDADYLLNLAVSNARNAGVVVCSAVGNDGIKFKNKYGAVTPIPKNIDFGPISTPASFSSATAVASADTTGSEKQYITLSDGSRIECSYAYTEGRIDLLPSKTEYVYCGLAEANDFTDIDVSGKIALVDRGENTFTEKADNAADAGAIGIIIAGVNSTSFATPELALPAATVKKAGGDILKSAKNKTIASFTTEQTSLSEPMISSFSSSGVAENLELKPDLTAPGRYIYSSDCDGGYVANSGTSMSSPYLSGSFAAMYEYLKYSDFKYTPDTKVLLAENLMMSTADIIRENGVPVSTRKQGAGIINLKKATETKFMLTDSTGRSKISLKDNLSDTFEIKLYAVNMSDTDATFNSPYVELCTDGVSGKNISTSPVSIPIKSCTLPETVFLPANSATSIEFTVTMDSEFTEKNLSTFTNGFFVDGFVYLSDALHIPFTGFYGNWAAASVFDRSMYDDGGSLLRINNSGGTYLYSHSVVNGATKSFYLGKNSATGAFEKKLIAISPNGDNYHDGLGISLQNMRATKQLDLFLVDSADNCYSLGSNFSVLNKFDSLSYYVELSNIPEGDYTLEINGILNYSGAEKFPSQLTLPVKIDYTAPKILSATLSNDRKKFTVTGSDNHYIKTFGLIYKDLDGTRHVLTQNTDTVGNDVAVAEFSVKNPDLSTFIIGCYDYAYNYTQASYTENVYINSSINDNTVSYTTVNNTGTALPQKVYVGFYDSHDKLISSAISTGTSGSFNVTDDMLKNVSYYKIFLWDENKTPYSKAPTFIIK